MADHHPLKIVATPILRLSAVCVRVGVSPSTIERMVRARQFPAPVRISKRAIGWSAAAVDAWISARIQAAAR